MTFKTEPEQHGRKLAERVLDQTARYGLGAEDVAIMIRHDIERQTVTMVAAGLPAEEIAAWTASVHVACRLRVCEERRALS